MKTIDIKPLRCSQCRAVVGFVPNDFTERNLKDFLCYECYVSPLEEDK